MGFGVWGLGFRVQGSGFRVYIGFTAWGLGFGGWFGGRQVGCRVPKVGDSHTWCHAGALRAFWARLWVQGV